MNARASRAGGCLLAASLITGPIVGMAYRQPSVGFLAGLGVGLVLAGLVWLLDRGRR